MQTIEVKDFGKSDEKGNVIIRVIVGKSGETKPTGYYENIPLRQGDMFIEYGGNNGSVVYVYDEIDATWYIM